MYLNEEVDEHGQHDQRVSKDVEQGESYEDLVCCESILWVSGVEVDQGIRGKGGQGDL